MYRLWINGTELEAQNFSEPSSLRTAYRGERAASRESGSAEFDVFHLDFEKPPAGMFAKGMAVVIQNQKRGLFRGVIDSYESELYVTHISAKELGAALNDYKAGFRKIGSVENPELYAFVEQHNYFHAGTGAAVKGHYVRRADSFQNDPEFNVGVEKLFLFDTYRYYVQSPGVQLRSMLFEEWPLAQIVNWALKEARSELGEVITADVRLAGPARTRNGRIVLDEQDDPLYTLTDLDGNPLPIGVCTRTVDEIPASFFWRTQHADDKTYLQLYQLVNHCRAMYLGKLEIRDPDLEGVHPLHGELGYGPFVVPDNPHFPYQLSFFTIGAVNDRDGITVVANIRTVDLRLPRQMNADGELLVRAITHRERGTSGATSYLELSDDGFFQFTDKKCVLRESRSTRTGGDYIASFFGPPVTWEGEILLTEMALDFRGGTIADVLHDAVKLAGCEWWIDLQRVLRIERLDRSERTVSIALDNEQVLEDRAPVVGAGQALTSLGISGVDLNPLYERVVLSELNALVGIFQGKRRRIGIVTDDNEFELGAQLQINARDEGRIVATEPREYSVTVETEAA